MPERQSDHPPFAKQNGFNSDLCFLGACAASVSLGLRAFQIADAEFKRTLLERSERIAAMITLDKVETRAPFHGAALAWR